jgi:cobalamin biosynthesis Mg chelatase CobN
MNSAAAPSIPRYVVCLSDALAALLSGAEGTEISAGVDRVIPEDELVDVLRAAGLVTYPSPTTAKHPSPAAAQADTYASQPPATAAAAAAAASVVTAATVSAPAHRVVRMEGAIAVLLDHAEGAETTEDEAKGLQISSSRPTLPRLLLLLLLILLLFLLLLLLLLRRPSV